MKRSEVEDEILGIILYINDYDSVTYVEVAKWILERLEQLGMLPPNNTCKLIDDGKGGTKHSAVERKWDEE